MTNHVKGANELKKKSKKSVQVKSTVCAVTATAMLCLAQPVWGDASNGVVTVTQVEAGGIVETVAQNVSTEIPEGAKISAKQAEETIKRLFPLLNKATVTNAEFAEQNNLSTGVKVWEIMFSFQRGNMGTGFSASVNAVTGEVVSVHIPRNLLLLLGEEPGQAVTREVASQKAKEWIKQNIKSINVNELTENPLYMGMAKSLFSPTTYEFYYNVSVNGIPSDADTISISVDEQGRVTSFSRQQSTKTTGSSVAKISAAEARKLYEESFAAELSYISSSPFGTSKGPYFLGYVPKSESNLAIDANTGSLLDYSGEPVKTDQFKPVEIPAGQGGYTSSPKPLSSGDDAVKWVESQIAIPKSFKATNKRLSQRWNDKESKAWNISYSDPLNSRDLMVEVDSKTGQIYNYNLYSYRYEAGMKQDQDKTSSAPKISKKDAEQNAFRTISKLTPDATKEWKLTSTTEPGKSDPYQSYQFAFTRYAGGIPISGDTLSIAIGTDGQLNQFSNYSFAKISDLPLNSKAVITEEEAKAAFLKETELKLKFAQYGGYMAMGGSSELYTKLVYAPVRKDAGQMYGISMPLDAVTGKWRETVPAEFFGTEASPAKDTKGHKSEAALDKMVQYRVLIPDEDQKVFPDQEITTGDWYLFVARALNSSVDQYSGGNTEPYGSLKPENKYYQAIQRLVSQNWLPFEPDASFNTERKLTRDELALMLTQILKYEKLGLSYTKEDVVPGASDSASIINKGAAIITMKLGLLPAIDGKFMPQQVVTRAEASEVLLRLSELAGKSDSFLNENYMW